MSKKGEANEGKVQPDTDGLPRLNPHDVMTNSIDESGENGLVVSGNHGRQSSLDSADQKPKASTFKITSVTIHTEKGSSQDGLVSIGDEEDESATEEPVVNHSENETQNQINTDIKKQDRTDSGSRFKVVKVQKKEPYTIGRWKISEYMSESDVNKTDHANHKKGSESGNSSRAGSNHYIHGVDDPSKNPLAGVITNNSQPSAATIQSNHAQQPIIDSHQTPLEPIVQTNHDENKLDSVHNNRVVETDAKAGHTIAASVQVAGQSLEQPSQPSGHSSPPGAKIQNVAANSGQILTSVISQSASSDSSSTIQPNNTQVQTIASSATIVPPSNLPIESQTQSLVNHTDEVARITDSRENVESLKSEQDNEVLDTPETAAELGAALDAALVDTPGSDGQKPEDADAAASGVAIDNKIEQAMDLVKSHLMLAVREEVEDLKLQIKQLIERNNQLEQENKLLRSSAAPETLAQLTLLSRQQSHSSTK